MFDFALTADQRTLRDQVRAFAASEIAPVAGACDRDRTLPPGLGKRFLEAGLGQTFLARGREEPYLTDICLITEELAYACAACASYLMLPVFFNRLLLGYLGDERRAILAGELERDHVVTSFAASERGAGSDLASMAVTVRRTAGGYQLDGRKEYSSNIRQARYVIVVARGPEEDDRVEPAQGRHAALTWLAVPTDSPGLEIGPRWETLGLRALDVSPIELHTVEVDPGARLGPEGAGLRMMHENLAQSRTGIAAVAVGIARRARDLVIEFGGRRRVFGEKLTRLQDYRFRIADMEKEIAAARSLVLLSAQKHDRGLEHGKEASIAKLYAGEMVMRLTEAASLMLGSVGYTGQSQVEKLFRDARHVGIVEGPEPIHREIIFAEMLRRGAY